MASWFGWKRGDSEKKEKVVLDGSNIEKLVENKEAFSSYVEHKFEELDQDHDGKLSVKELEPAVAHIGAALGLPAQGLSPDSDHIYSELLDAAWNDLSKEHHHKALKEHLRITLDRIAASAGLPPYGAVAQVDTVINEAMKMVHADDGNVAKEDEFKKTMTEILGSIMLQLEGNPVFVSLNSVVHEPLGSSSTLLPLSPESELPQND